MSVTPLLFLVFFLQTYLSSLPKSPVYDTGPHYAVGEWALGKPVRPGEPVMWEGTSPVTALHVLSARVRSRLTGLLGPPSDPYTTEQAQIPSILWARIPSMLLGTALVFLIWLYARRFFGELAALCALFLAAFEPNLIGHSRFITTDIAAALAFLSGTFALAWYVQRPGWRRLIFLSLVLALAQIAKLSCLLLYPIGLAFISMVLPAFCSGRSASGPRPVIDRPLQKAGRSRWLALWACLSASLRPAALFAITFVLVLQLAYSGFAPERTIEQPGRMGEELVNQFCAPLCGLDPVIPLPYIQSFALGRAHNHNGHPAYLMGQRSTHGWSYYFPVAIALKTPLPLLLLALGSLLFGLRRHIRNPGFQILIFSAAAYLVYFCLFVNVNIGVRHVFPVYPALIIAAGLMLAQIWEQIRRESKRRWLLVAAAALFLAWSVREAAVIYPHYEEYFNQLAGGPRNGWRLLSDSNLDWGQDAFIIQEWVARQTRPVSLNPSQPVHGLVIVNAGVLIGYTPEMTASYSWLRDHYEPVGHVTPGVLIYDVP